MFLFSVATSRIEYWLTLIWVGFLGVHSEVGGGGSFFCKKLAFFVQKSTITQSKSVRAVLEIF